MYYLYLMIKANTFTAQIEDNNFRKFPIEITYDYVIKLFATQVVHYEWCLDSAAKISKGDLDNIVKDLIKDEESTYIEFI